MFLIYSVLFTVGLIFALPYYLWRYRGRHLLGNYWRERLGFLPESFNASDSQAVPAGGIWFHAVSVGETLAIAGLVRAVQERWPERPIYISHVTPTGREAGEKRLPAVAGRFYLPLDWRWSLRRAFQRLRPAMLVIAETELWPNLLRTARDAGARVVLVNARLSDRSFRGYRLFRPFLRRVLAQIDWICAQSSTDRDRFRMLGMPAERISVAGNLKFDARAPQPGAFAAQLGRALASAERGPVMVAASTMAGEEGLVFKAWDEILLKHPKALLILAPRHPQRFEDVEELLASRGLRFIRRTALAAADHELVRQLADAQVFLLNTIGELSNILQVADVVFIGGSLVPTGGHNLVEPALWRKAIIFGPHMENFRDAAEIFLCSGAAIRVQNEHELALEALSLLADARRREQFGEAGWALVERESGATGRVVEQMARWLEPRPLVARAVELTERHSA